MTSTDTLPAPSPGARVRPLAGAVAAEWVRFRSVRSTWWGLAAALVLMVLVSAMGAINTASAMERGSLPAADLPASEMAVYGSVWAVQFALVGVALTFAASEYAHGSVQASLQAVPVRWRWFTAKAVVVAAVTFSSSLVIAAVGTLTAHLVLSHPLLGGHGTLVLSRAAADALRCAVFLTLLSLTGLGTGTALRSAAASLTTVSLLVLGLPVMTLFSANALVAAVSVRLPLTAAIAFLGSDHVIGPLEGALTPSGGLVVLMVWAATALAAGVLVLRYRDA
ncbi:ABC transporter permease [Nocardiopsis sp. NPDC007018]|uniref:ABC transporter permease n=1 Tax=Nocardiopsis sp. NPDC007018 TaxID=3155721 RepID=UPI0033D1E330